MSTTTMTLPVVPLSRALTRQWILAYAGAAAVGAVGIFAATQLTSLFGLQAADAGWTARGIAVALFAAVELIYGLAYAHLRGAVLRQMLPNLPMRTWYIVIGGLMAIFGAIVGISANGVANGTTAASISADQLLVGMIGMSVVGLVFGTVIGTAEALLMRKTAASTGWWVAISAVAHGVGVPVMLLGASIGLLQGNLGAFGLLFSGIVTQVLMQATIGAVMLTALISLRPR
jgi:hypothetical protein